MSEPATRTANAWAPENFKKFFESWIVEQEQHLQELVSAARDWAPETLSHRRRLGQQAENGSRSGESEPVRSLVDRVARHYEQYYRAKSSWAKRDVLSMFSPSWLSSLEDAFLWIGGWRPTMAFHLLYSKSGLQLEAHLPELIRGLTFHDLGDLSPHQLARVDGLHQTAVREEREITEELARHQETIADASMVELSGVVSELIRGGVEDGDRTESERVDSAVAIKKDGLEEILQRADDLRLRTLKGVIDILTPIQAVHFLIAAAELHLRFHDWGKKTDEANSYVNGLQPHHQTS